MRKMPSRNSPPIARFTNMKRGMLASLVVDHCSLIEPIVDNLVLIKFCVFLLKLYCCTATCCWLNLEEWHTRPESNLVLRTRPNEVCAMKAPFTPACQVALWPEDVGWLDSAMVKGQVGFGFPRLTRQ